MQQLYKKTFVHTCFISLFVLFAGAVFVSTGAAFAAPQQSQQSARFGVLSTLTQKTKAAQHAQSSPFKIRALHFYAAKSRRAAPGLPSIKHTIAQAALRGYNVVILQLNWTHGSLIHEPEVGQVEVDGWTDKQMRQLIAYSRQQGIEPVIEIKLIGKQLPIMGKLLKRYPDLIVRSGVDSTRGVINSAFHFPDGRSAYQAVELPLIAKALSWYGKNKPKYFLMGVDEIASDALAKVGEKTGQSASQVFADGVNQCADYLLKRGITPIIWGDMLLSRKLSKPGAVKGFAGDARFSNGESSFHATDYMAGNTGAETLSAVNLIKQRKNIIVADWHYGTVLDGQYPSVDYFRHMGFKAVWAATFENMQAVRAFTRYAASRSAEGMIATTWGRRPGDVHWVSIVNNSALYFIKPDFQPPAKPGFKVAGEHVKHGKFGAVVPNSKSNFSITIDLPKEAQAEHIGMWLKNQETGQKISAASESIEKNKVSAQFALDHKRNSDILFNLWLRYQDSNTGYVAQAEYPGAVVSSNNIPLPVAGAAGQQNTLFEIDFAQLAKSLSKPKILKKRSKIIVAPGRYGGYLLLGGIKSGAQPLANGSLNSMAVNATYGWPGQGLWKYIAKHGMRLVVVAKMKRHLKKSPWCSLVSYGTYLRGFRLLIGKQGNVLMQFAKTKNGRRPVWIEPAGKMEPGKWQRIEIKLSPPDKQGVRQIAAQIKGHKPSHYKLPQRLWAPMVPLTVGIQFKDQGGKKLWPNFPGNIRSVSIYPYKK